VTTVNTSGFLGTKVGGMIGLLLGGPVGAVFGGCIGGALGVVSGKCVANSIKKIPLNDAKEEYEYSYRILKVESDRLNEWVGKTWVSIQKKKQDEFNNYINNLDLEMEQESKKIQVLIESAIKMSYEDIKHLLLIAEQKIIYEAKYSEKILKKDLNFFQKLFIEWTNSNLASKIYCNNLRSTEWISCKTNLLLLAKEDSVYLPDVFDLVLAIPSGHDLAIKYISNVKSLRQKAFCCLNKVRTDLNKKALIQRQKVIEDLRNSWNNIKKHTEINLSQEIKRYQKARAELEVEKAKAGYYM
jgi:hypothetical protein